MKRGRSRKKKATFCGSTRTAKVRFRTLEDAKGARSALQTGRHNGEGKDVRIYKCPECRGYHLTTQPLMEWGNSHTIWKSPDRAVSSENEPNDTEETQNGQDH